MLDLTDIKILNELQSDGRISIAKLSQKVAISTSSCLRRVKCLEKNGVIEKYTALLSQKKFGINSEIFLLVKMKNQSRKTLDRFQDQISELNEVMECFLLSGEFDYLIKLGVKNNENLLAIHNRIAESPDVSRINSFFSLQKVVHKTSPTLPG